MAAKKEQMNREYRYRSDSLKYWNKETTWKTSQNAAAIGFSRASSDAYEKAMATLGQGRKSTESAVITYEKGRFKSLAHEAGRARTAGQSGLRTLLRAQGDINNAIEKQFNRNYDKYHQQNIRTLQAYRAKANKALGIKPEWGPPVMMPGKDKAGQLFANLQMGLSIASTVAGIPGVKTAIGNKFGSMFGAAGGAPGSIGWQAPTGAAAGGSIGSQLGAGLFQY